MLIGAHISAAGGVINAPDNAKKHGAECYQFFSRSPQGGKASKLTDSIIKEFKEKNKKYKFEDYYIHAPYYINLASSKNNIYFGSISVLREELERGTRLGAQGMMFHIGSAKDMPSRDAIYRVSKGLREVVKGYKGSCQPLLEISAGAGNIIGDSFEEIAEIIKKVEGGSGLALGSAKSRNAAPGRTWSQQGFGVCFDTAHAFASGYDLRDKKSVTKTFNEFDKIIGLKRLKLIHVNDSKTDLGSRKDRHEHIGKGKIGLAGFKAIIQNKKLKKINLILETPTDAGILKDIKLLKRLRDTR